MGKKNKGGADFISKIPKGIWLFISFIVAMLVWTLLSVTPQTARCFPNAVKVVESIGLMQGERGILLQDIRKQFDFRILGIPSGICDFCAGSLSDGLVQTGTVYS